MSKKRNGTGIRVYFSTIFSQDGKIYTLGYYLDSYNRIPCYWINGERMELDSEGLSGSFFANRIKVQDGKVFVIGHYFIGDKGVYENFYWVDGKRTDLGLGSISSIYVENDIIYTTGSYKVDEYDSGNACYWVNGERKILPIPLLTQFSRVESIYKHDEKIYLFGGYYIRERKGINKKACYWVNGERTDLTPPDSGWSDIHSIFVDKDQIYAAGRYNSGDFFSKSTACYWVNGKRKKLSEPSGFFEGSSALYIEVLNGNMYILGSFRHNVMWNGRCYWVNGQRTDFVPEKNEDIIDATFTINEMPVE